MNTTEMPSRVDTVTRTTSAGSDPARLTDITKQLAEDVRPLVARLQPAIERAHPLIAQARRRADVMLPLVDELRPVLDDLRPVMHDLRALLGVLLARLGVAAAQLDLGPLTSVGRTLAARARGVASIRPALPFARPSFSLPAAPGVSLPSIHAPHALMQRLRPGRWAFRTIAIGMIAFVASDATLRDAMVAEVNWTRSAVEKVEMPAIQIPTIELPAIELPTIELPTFELPAIQIPNIDLAALFSQPQEPTAAPKLAQAQFELPPLNAYRAAFESQASYPTVAPNAAVEWVVALRNTGSAGWYRGVAGAQASLALTDGTEAAVQTTPYVAPGQVGWFIVHFRAPGAPGAHAVPLLPRIDGRGELPNLGLFALVTVR
jgi:hypothetical protein